jgi:hypothetical protein
MYPLFARSTAELIAELPRLHTRMLTFDARQMYRLAGSVEDTIYDVEAELAARAERGDTEADAWLTKATAA